MTVASAVERKIRVLIVEDHPGVRAGIRTLLQSASDVQVVGEAADGTQALELASRKQPDVMLLDLALPAVRGDTVMGRVLKAQPDVSVLIVTAYDDAEYARGLLANGAAGYLTKDEVPRSLLNAVRSVYRHAEQTWVSPRMLASHVFPIRRIIPSTRAG